MRILLPWPPSVNNLYVNVGKARRLTQRGKDYCELVAELLLEQGITKRFSKDRRLGIEITAWPPDKRIRDLDNLLKAPCDAMKKAKLYPDDSQFNHILIHKGGEVYDELIELTLGEPR
ncbi:MAG: RusA family crossover junction endodeoxyribonuclease [bacterium]